MMTSKNFLIFILLLFPLIGVGQEDANKLPTFSLKTAPAANLDFVSGGRAGLDLELGLGKRFSVEGRGSMYTGLVGYGVRKQRGWRLGGALRYYCDTTVDLPFFIGVNVWTAQQNFWSKDSITPLDSLTVGYRKVNHLDRQILAFNVSSGFKTYVSERVFFEVVLEVGVRHKQTTCSGLTESELARRDYGDSFVFPNVMECGDVWRMHANARFRIGIALGN